MNTKEFTYILQNPKQLDKEQGYALEKIIKTFPYFQSARSLFLKSLKSQESFRYNQELKITAAHTTDRSVLFDFITSDIFKENTKNQDVKKKHTSEIEVIDPQEIKASPRITMDEAIRMKIKEAEDVLDPALFFTRKENKPLKSLEKESEISETQQDLQKSEKQNKTPEEILQINKPLDFTKKETHSFTEWLKITSLDPIKRDSNQKTTSSNSKNKENKSQKPLEQKDKFNLIDEFIASNPKIKPVAKNAPARDLTKENTVPTDELMTETLARVYLNQKNYKKAIQAYNILILKNPEKSGFFADQIRAIKKTQENK
ncbi:hypothetical protein [Aquimarina muelleri]|uniref:Tetratricopeptide repeat protein n=1 Tax=Aquimarina muelleri TaxID=279356 RepID=A0A918N4B2_9FLAO|nr:hypothetical protein [Aquimarina muelleri]MCX2763623.1 hypothetical protein [Aquimarina muelleri]GGX26655.1 hypothetical protein GCM10007384_29710 [Aquimarina muelleri]